MGQPTDAELWRLAAGGDAAVFGVLFERHAYAVYNFCFRRTADWAAAEDLTSIVFLEAWRRRADVHLQDGARASVAARSRNQRPAQIGGARRGGTEPLSRAFRSNWAPISPTTSTAA